jgi:hypothetical protein
VVSGIRLAGIKFLEADGVGEQQLGEIQLALNGGGTGKAPSRLGEGKAARHSLMDLRLAAGGALPEDILGVYLTENAGIFFGVRASRSQHRAIRSRERRSVHRDS